MIAVTAPSFERFHLRRSSKAHQLDSFSIGIKASQFITVSHTALPTSSSNSMSHIMITGAQGGLQQGAAAPNRIEINDFVKMQQPFSLYIQALSELHFVFLMPSDKINPSENSCHVPDLTGQFHLSLCYWGYPRPSLCRVGGVWWLPSRKRVSVGWVLHSRLCTIPILA